MTIYYFQKGKLNNFIAKSLTDAYNKRTKLIREKGRNFSGVGHFHHYVNGERKWL